MSKNLFVVGTGTDVGKTYITGLILKKLRENGLSAGYYKAAMSGNRRDSNGRLIPGDALHVKQRSGIGQPVKDMCPFVYEQTVSPHLASRTEGNPVRMDRVRRGFEEICAQYDYVTMEGSGGILCPLRLEDGQSLWLADVVKALGLGCLLVADAGLGTINQVGLTCFYLKTQGIPLRGMIFNRFDPGDLMHRDNVEVCRQLTGVPVITCVKEGDTQLDVLLGQLQQLYQEGRDGLS